HTECRGILHREVRQDLAVDRQSGCIQSSDQLAVRQAVDARFGVDARDPERSHVPLVCLAVPIGILARLDDGLLRDAVHLAASVVVTLRLLQVLLVTGARDDASLNACHVSILTSRAGAAARAAPDLVSRPCSARAAGAYACSASWSGCDDDGIGFA